MKHYALMMLFILLFSHPTSAQHRMKSWQDSVNTFAPIVNKRLQKWASTYNDYEIDLWKFEPDDADRFTGSIYSISAALKLSFIDSLLVFFSPDSSKYVDIYSSNHTIVIGDGKLKRLVPDKWPGSGDAPRGDQRVTIVDMEKKRGVDIYLNSRFMLCEDAVWIDPNRFLVVGYYGVKKPFFWIFDIKQLQHRMFVRPGRFYPEWSRGSYFRVKFPSILGENSN